MREYKLSQARKENPMPDAEKRLRQPGKDAGEAMRSRVETLLRIRQLLGKGKPGRPKRMSEESDIKTSEESDISLTRQQRDRRHHARLLTEFEKLVREELLTGRSVSLSRMVKICQRKRANRDIPMPDRRYAILRVDPPWQYEGAESGNRQIENHYGTMPLEESKLLEPPAAGSWRGVSW